MWRCSSGPVFSPSMPVPTFHPHEGADLHSHSPRRKPKESKAPAYLDSFMVGNMFHTQPSTSFWGGQPFTMPSYPPRRNATTAPSPSFQDVCSAYGNYASWGFPSGQSPGEGLDASKTTWPGITRNSRKQSSTVTSMPDYVSSEGSDRMHISGPSLEDDRMSSKAPTNTPTTSAAENPQAAPFALSVSHNISSELATTLAHSLLDQPLPIPIHPHTVAFPSSEIKSRKENWHLNIADSNPPSAHSTPHATYSRHEARTFSQPIFGLVKNMGSGLPLPTAAVTVDNSHSVLPSPQLGIFSADISRTTSAGEFSPNIPQLNMGHGIPCSPISHSPRDALTQSTGNRITSGPLVSGLNTSVVGKTGMKRGRNFTPASSKVIDDEDEPRRASPHVRITGYVGGVADET